MVLNITGWNELMNGDLIGAAFIMYDTAMVHWFVPILFFVYQIMLYMKTENTTICWITGLFFICLYCVSWFAISVAAQIMFVILVFELAGILFVWFFL